MVVEILSAVARLVVAACQGRSVHDTCLFEGIALFKKGSSQSRLFAYRCGGDVSAAGLRRAYPAQTSE